MARGLSLAAKPRGPSIRRHLQATSLLAVLAGYVVLLYAHREMAANLRQQRHIALAQATGLALGQRRSPAGKGRDPLTQQLADHSTPLVLVWIEPISRARGPVLLPPGEVFRGLRDEPGLIAAADAAAQKAANPLFVEFSHRGRSLVTSSQPLNLAGQPHRLHLLQDFTVELQQEQVVTLLLVAVAGASALFTSALLRLVIHRGLLPLDAFSATLAGMGSSSLSTDRLPLADQPLELQPIASSFNDLLDRLSEAWEHQRTFVNGVSHELRTPITLIAGYSRRLLRRASTLTPEQAGQLELVASEAESMGRLVNDLLEIARDDAGRLQLNCRAFDPYQLLRDLQLRLERTAGGRLLLQPGPRFDGEVSGDPERLSQCLTNLVENALKYSPPATPIELALSQDGAELVWHVRDHGPGVPAAERLRIFERFVRGASQAGSAGHGIGLAVVKTLMERMGGRVLVAQPATGNGADFQLRLPVLRSNPPSVHPRRWFSPV